MWVVLLEGVVEVESECGGGAGGEGGAGGKGGCGGGDAGQGVLPV